MSCRGCVPLLAVIALGAWVAGPAAAQFGTATPTNTPSATVATSPTPTPSAVGSPSVTASPTFARTPPLTDVDVDGTFRGNWSTATRAGGLTLTLVQDGEAVTGTAVFEGHPCLSLGRVNGRVSGNTLTGTLAAVTSPALGNLRLNSAPGRLNGTYSLQSGCADAATGAIAVFRTGPATPRGTPTATPSRPLVTATPTPSATATPTPAAVGDCDGDGTITVDEVVAMVSIGLSTRPLDLCPAADRNVDGLVTVDEILRGVFGALSGIVAGDTPPPLVLRCVELGTTECVCRGDVCCRAGECARGEPCVGDNDCALGLRCVDEDGQGVCGDAGVIVVPPPR